MKIIKGNIVDAKEDLILHQVNCQNAMGSGVAKALYEKYPDVKTMYHDFCNDWEKKGLPKDGLLGQICVVKLEWNRFVINCFSQFTYGNDGKLHTNYDAVSTCFTNVISLLRVNDFTEATVAIPYLYGCGLGGGDWEVVSRIIEESFGDRAVIYKLGE